MIYLVLRYIYDWRKYLRFKGVSQQRSEQIYQLCANGHWVIINGYIILTAAVTHVTHVDRQHDYKSNYIFAGVVTQELTSVPGFVTRCIMFTRNVSHVSLLEIYILIGQYLPSQWTNCIHVWPYLHVPLFYTVWHTLIKPCKLCVMLSHS